jgi:hypothetical protein
LVDLVPGHAERCGHPVAAEEGRAALIRRDRQQYEHGRGVRPDLCQPAIV